MKTSSSPNTASVSRREFLRAFDLALATGALAAQKVAAQVGVSPGETLRVGLV